MFTILVTGASGLLGSNLLAKKPDYLKVIGVRGRGNPETSSLQSIDLSIKENRDGLLEKFSVDCVINCAALTSIEICEKHPDLAKEINYEMPLDLARQAKALGTKFIQISTDAVFDGTSEMYREEDTPRPVNVYGKLKADAEKAVLDANHLSIVVRTNFYGWSGLKNKSLAEFFITEMRLGNTVRGFRDSIVSFTDVDLLSKRLFSLFELDFDGILHLGSSTGISKLDFAHLLASRFGLDSNLILKASMKDILSVPRGLNLSLSSKLSEKVLGMPCPSHEEGVESLFMAEASNRTELLLRLID